MSVEDIIEAQRRMAAIERETGLYGVMGLAAKIEAASQLYPFESTIARIQNQINPAAGIVNVLRENIASESKIVRFLQQGVADATRDALRLQEVERGIAQLRDSLLAAQDETNRFVARVNAATAATLRSLQQPLIEFNEYIRGLERLVAQPYIAELSAVQKAAQGIAAIYKFTGADLVASEAVDAAEQEEESSISDEELEELFSTAFPETGAPITVQAFERGVEIIVAAIKSTKDSRIQKAIALYAYPLLLCLLTIFLSSQEPKQLPPKEAQQVSAKAHSEPKARMGRAKNQQSSTVIADVLNVRQTHSGRSRIIGKLKSGDRVTVIQAKGAWTHVETSHVSGWVVTIYLRTVDG
jgi:SH3 domain-containing protein